jgi:hypothetical protein
MDGGAVAGGGNAVRAMTTTALGCGAVGSATGSAQEAVRLMHSGQTGQPAGLCGAVGA